MKAPLTGNETIYKLTLSDGRTWGFSADANIRPWLKSFMDMMQLKEGVKSGIDAVLTFSTRKDAAPFSAPGNDQKRELYKSGSIFRARTHGAAYEIFVKFDPDAVDHDIISIINMWNSLKPLYKYYTENGGGPIHAAYAGLKNKGILIAAPGNTGKSTCISRLPGYWNKISDDTALIVHTETNTYRAHPIPTWSDYLCNRKKSTYNFSYSLPLTAIFFLEQAASDDVIPLHKGQAASEIFESFKQSWRTYWHRMDEDRRKIRQMQAFENSMTLAKKIPCYRLKATRHGEFWKEIEEAINSCP